MSNKNYLSIYAKSFNWAGFFLPKKTYQKCSALYDFCRTVDNIADDDGELDIKKKNLSVFKNDFINKNYNNIIIKNMWDLMNHHLISIKVVKDLFNGVDSDLNKRPTNLRSPITTAPPRIPNPRRWKDCMTGNNHKDPLTYSPI